MTIQGNIDNGNIITLGASLSVGGNFTNDGTFTANGNTVTFNGGTTQEVTASSSFGDNNPFGSITVSTDGDGNPTTVNLNADPTQINDSLKIESGNTVNPKGRIDLKGDLINNDTYSGSGNTLRLDGSGNQNISGTGSSFSVGKLVVRNNDDSRQVTFDIDATASSDVEVGDSLDASGTEFKFNGTSAQSLSGDVTPSFGSVTNENATSSGLTLNVPIEVAGDLTNNASFDANEQTIILNGSAQQSISGFGSSNPLYNLTVNFQSPSGSADVILSDATEIRNDLTLSSGDLDTQGNLTVASNFDGSTVQDAAILGDGGSFSNSSSSDDTAERLIDGSEAGPEDEGDSSAGTVGDDAEWRLMSPPFASQIQAGALSEDTGDGPLVVDLQNNGGQGYMIYKWDEANADWLDPDEEDGSSVDDDTFPLDPNDGFLLYFFDDDKDPIPNSGMTVSASAPLHGVSSSETITVSHNGSSPFVLIGNPYPAGYDLSEVTVNGNSITSESNAEINQIQIYDPREGGYANNTYVVGNEGSDTPPVVGAWQGFFVEVDQDAASSDIDLEFPTSGLTGDQNSDDAFIKSNGSESPEMQLALDKVLSEGNNGDLSDLGMSTKPADPGVRIRFNNSASPEYDGADAQKLVMPTVGGSRSGSAAIEKALLAALGADSDNNTIWKSIDARPIPSSFPITLDVAFDCANFESSTTFLADIRNVKNIPNDWIVRLNDTHADSTVTLYAGEGTSVEDEHYKFDVSKSDCGSSLNKSQNRAANGASSPLVYDGSLTGDASAKAATGSRFELEITPEEIPPVEINGFNGAVEQKDVVLEWETNNETNNDGFYVQHRREGSSEDDAFEDLTFIESKIEDGVSERSFSYRHRIEDLDVGTHTFRLKQVDVDGHTSLSEKIDVKVGLSGQHLLTAYPNPLHDQATVEFAVKDRRSVTLELYNTLGQRVKTLHQDTVPAEETQRLTLDATSLSSGLYVLRLRGDGFSINETVTVVH